MTAENRIDLVLVLYAIFVILLWELAGWLTRWRRNRNKPPQYVVKNMDPKPLAAALHDLAYKIGDGEFAWESGGILMDEDGEGRWVVISDLKIRPIKRCEK